MNEDDMRRVHDALGDAYKNAPRHVQEMAEGLASMSQMIHDAYAVNSDVAGKMFAGVISAAFVAIADDIDGALALNGKMYADIRKNIVKIDKVVTTGGLNGRE